MTDLDCSPVTGSVTLNEINTKANPDYIELYFLADITIDANDWYLWIDQDQQAEVPAGDYAAGDFLLLTASLNPSNQEVMLVSSSADPLTAGEPVVIDYLGYGGAGNFHPTWSVPDSCGTVYADHSANQEVIDRLPDGTGDWADHSSNATPGASNDGSSASCALSAISVQAQTYALACPMTRAAVSLSALCIDGSLKSDYAGTFTISLDQPSATVYTNSSGGSAVDQVSFDGTEGGILTVYVEDTDEHITTITASESILSGSDSIDFRAYGFLMSSAPSMLACARQTTTLTAYGQDNNASGCDVIEGFNGHKSLKAWFDYLQPDSNEYGTSLILTDLNGDQSLPTIQPDTENIVLDFVNGVANLPISYVDVGQLMINYRYDQLPYDGSELSPMMVSSIPISILPAGFGLRAYTTADTELNNGSTSGEPHWPAGNDFKLQVKAQCVDGTLLPNYQPTDAEIWIEMSLPTTMYTGKLNLKGSDYPTSYTEPASWFNVSGLFSGGMINDSGFDHTKARFSEVGVFRLHVRDSNYLGGAVGEQILTVGRFTPAYLQVNSTQNGQMQPSCNGLFVYTGEAMYYSVPPSITITARNAEGVITGNYSGEFMKLIESAGGAITFINPTSDGTQLGKDATHLTDIDVTLHSNLSNLQDNGDGTFVYFLSALDSFSYTRNDNALVSPYISDIDLVFSSIIDGDGIVDDGVSIVLSPAGAVVRYGRLVLDDAYGPQTDNLTLTVRAEYFDGSDFIDNLDDYCSSIAPMGAVGLSNWQGSLSSGDTSVISSVGLLAGSGEIQLSAPGVGTDGDTNDGSVDLTLDLAITSPVQTWLLNDENGDGVFAENPVGTASFGMYRGDDRFLYWRETQ